MLYHSGFASYKGIQKLKSKINNFIKADNRTSRVAKSGILVAFGGASDRIIRFLRNIILTRILAPEIFGVIAIILSVQFFFETLTNIGVKQAIIQNPHSEERAFQNGAWWLSVLRGVLMYVVAFFLSPYIADFYKNPDLVSLMRVSFLALVINGLMSIKAFIAIKKMNFKKWIIIDNGGGSIGVIISIGLGFYLKNEWALVLGYIFESLFRLLFSYILCPYLPGFKFEKKYIASILNYAKGMFGIPILLFLYSKIDIFVIGKIISSVELGLYSMASLLARMPLEFISSIVDQIFLPAISEIQNDSEKINKVMIRSISLLLFIGSPALFLVALYGKEILTIAFGVKYAKVAAPFAIIFGSELIRISTTPIATMYFATGRPHLHRMFSIARAIPMAICIYPLTKYFGLVGASISGVVAIITGLIVQLYQINRITGFKPQQYFILLAKEMSVALIIPAIWFASTFFEMNIYMKLSIGVVSCLLAYGLGLLILFDRENIFKRK